MRAKSVQRVRAVALATVRGAAVVLAAIGVWLLSRVTARQAVSAWITRFVFRPPIEACPRCGHELTANAAVCSECGQRGLA